MLYREKLFFFVLFLKTAVPDDLNVLLVLTLAFPPPAVHDGGIHVGGGEGVGLVEQGDDAEQDGPERREKKKSTAKDEGETKGTEGWEGK